MHPDNIGKQFKPFNPEPGMYQEGTVHMVPTEVAARYIQQDRASARGELGPGSRQTIDELKDSITKHGWTSAISLAHDKENNWGAIIEGNHRVAAAKELGLTHIPAQVHTMGYPDDGFTRSPRVGAPLHLDTKDEMPRYAYVSPTHFRELR